VKTSLRARVLAVALLTGVVAVSSALADSENASSFTAISTPGGKTVLPLRINWRAYPQTDPSQGQVAAVDHFIAPAFTDASHERRSR
jgi:hypothetical protein